MHPVTALIQRNLGRLGPGDQITWINPPDDVPGSFTGTSLAAARYFSQDYGTCRRFDAAHAEIHFSDFPDPGSRRDTHVLLTLPKGKNLLRMLLHCVAERWPQGTALWLMGENRGGIKSAGSVLSEHYASVSKLDSARHCSLFEARDPVRGKAFEADAYRSEFPVSCADRDLRLVSWPGVFAHGKLDEGTALLLPHVAALSVAQRALDFGTGCGALGACMAAGNPGVEIVMSDNSAMALRSARATLELNGLSATVVRSDGFTGVEGRFDLVVSNPPFHREHATMNDLSIGLMAPVRNFLVAGGQLLLVANRHLPYRKWLDEMFGGHTVLESNPRYHVLRARLTDKPDKPERGQQPGTKE